MYVPFITKYLNLSVFNIVTAINELKALTKHKSWECKCNFDGKKCYSNQSWNYDKCQCECKKRHACENDYFWNTATCNCKIVKHPSSIKYDSAITCDKVIESYDEEKNFNEKKAICKMQNFYILRRFLLITFELLLAVSIYCYLIKH